MRSVMTPWALECQGAIGCPVPSTCGASYVGKTGRTVNVRIVEHQRHVRLGETNKPAIVQHCWSLGQSFYLNH